MAVNTPINLPTGGELVVVDGVHIYVRYDVGGRSVWFHVTDPQAAADAGLEQSMGRATQMSSQDPLFAQGIKAGDIHELIDVAANLPAGSSFSQSLTKQIEILSGGNPVFASDPEIQAILLDAAVNPDISQAEIESRLKQTNYYKGRTQAQLEWDRLSPAEQQARIARSAAELARLWFTNIGAEINFSDPTLVDWATKVASGRSSAGEVLETWIKVEAEKNPESPWSREIRKATEDTRQRGVDIENTSALVRDLQRRWAVPMSEEWLQRWANDLTTKVKSQADFESYLEKQASILYPWKDPSVETADAAEPYLQTYARTLEKGVPGMENKLIQKALQTGMPLFEFEKELRRQPEWMGTKNAQDELIGAFGQISRTMGFA